MNISHSFAADPSFLRIRARMLGCQAARDMGATKPVFKGYSTSNGNIILKDEAGRHYSYDAVIEECLLCVGIIPTTERP